MHDLATIVVGVDFTPGSLAAFRQALRIGAWNRARVHAVHVIDTLVLQDLEAALSPYQKDIRDGLVADAHSAWKEWSGAVPGASRATFEAVVQNRVEGLLVAASHERADLLVVGAYGEHAANVGVGTMATACVRRSPCAALVVRDSQPGPFRTVVAGVDFSPTSLRALDAAARVATQDAAALHVLHVFEPPWRSLRSRALNPETDARLQSIYRQSLDQRLHAFAAELGREIDYLKPTFTLFDHHGHRSGISEYAQSVNADLIALGTRGRTNARDLLLGSTAEKALRDTPCSILAVKPGA